MALPVTMYRWDDPGAPQVVDGKPSEYMNVIKKCLVEGYGSKTSLGWALVDSGISPPFMAFQNDIASGHSGGTLLLSSQDDNNWSSNVRVQSCLEYVSKNTKSKAGAFFEFNAGTSTPAYMSTKWVLIGTSAAFYFFSFPGHKLAANYMSNSVVPCFFSGDINSFIENDQCRFVTMSGGLNVTATSYSYSFINPLSQGYDTSVGYIYNIDGSSEYKEFNIKTLLPQPIYSSSTVNYDYSPEINFLSSAYCTIKTSSIVSDENLNDSSSPFVRGVIPGLFYAYQPGYRNSGPVPFIKSFDGTDYFLVPHVGTYQSMCWISLGSW
jgi:hypothetical protein